MTSRKERLLMVLSVCVFTFCTSTSICLANRETININPVWRFMAADSEEFSDPKFNDTEWDIVSLPHTHKVSYINIRMFPAVGRAIGWYRRDLEVRPEWLKKRVSLVFQGAMQSTKLWVNGKYVGEYAVSGYDSFHFDITRFLKEDANKLAIRVDNTENPVLPPDGIYMDFKLFGGLYRDLDVVVSDRLYVTLPWEDKKAGIRLTTSDISEKQAVVVVETTVRNGFAKDAKCNLLNEIVDKEGNVVASLSAEQSIPQGGTHTFVQKADPLQNPHLWSPDSPYLYDVRTTVKSDDAVTDTVHTRLGIRSVVFQGGLFLNGKRLKLVGANRHQTWPFIGNAVPNGCHKRDADMIKAMGMNWIRLSHYPHDPDFLDYLDEIGLMALGEGSTWWVSGGPVWDDNLEKSFRSMIRRDRNHPSIFIWNCCINHRKALPRLVNAAKEEDPGRARGQDNVPCPMNFGKSVSGGNAVCIEHTGHTFATERGLDDVREEELAYWHLHHTDLAYKTETNSGLAVWCAFDYNTFHNAKDGIAQHGVFDLLRLPKFSRYWYTSELTKEPMVYVYKHKDDQAFAYSNCEKIRVSVDTGKGLKETGEHEPDKYDNEKAEYALQHPPFHFAVSKDAIAVKAEGLKDGKVVASHVWRKPGKPVALKLRADRETIIADGSDVSRLIVDAVDENGTIVRTCNDLVEFSIKGNAQLIGESPVKLRHGSIIILAQSSFIPGEAEISVKAEGMKGGTCRVKTLPVAAHVDMPKKLPADGPKSTILRDVKVNFRPLGFPQWQGEFQRRMAQEKADRLGMDALSDNEKHLIKRANEIRAKKEKARKTMDERRARGGHKSNVPFSFSPVSDAKPGVWVESEPIMLSNINGDVKISIAGGEYRVYTAPWTTAEGTVTGGDAIFVRVKSSPKAGAEVSAKLTIDGVTEAFNVKTGQ